MPWAPTWETWLTTANALEVDPDRGLRFNHADHGLDAAAEGAGVVFGRRTLAARDIRLGRLVAPFELEVRVPGSFWFICQEDDLQRPKISQFRDWIMAEAA